MRLFLSILLLAAALLAQTPATTVEHVGGDVKAPKLIAHPEPANVRLPKVDGHDLITKVALIVETDGAVSHPTVQTSSGRTDLDQQAVDTVSKWRFKPATKHGNPVPVSLIIDVNYSK